MNSALYLLSIEEFLDESGEELFQAAFIKVDEERRRKALLLKNSSSRAVSLGAGLLLQLAVGKALEAGDDEELFLPKCSEDSCRRLPKPYSVRQLLERLEGKPLIPVLYRYGERGKPYFMDLPFYFSLSHSGNYVLCALSMKEIGADIQQHRGSCTRQIAERFFSRQELEALQERGDDGEEFFFRLWARKEAFGKLDGGGIMESLGASLLPERFCPSGGRELFWEEYQDLAGYSVAVCQYRE